MKKIISICSVIVVAALMLCLFTSCGGNDNDKESTTNTTASAQGDNATDAPVIGELTLEVKENEAVVFNDGAEFRKLIYPQNKNTPFDFDYAKEHYDFIDMNFDGNTDVYIAVADVDGLIHYYCFLYNATTTQFDYSVSLSALTNISVDSAEQVVFATGYDNDGNKVISKYIWVEGVLTNDSIFNESESIPQEVEQSAGNNAIGSKPHSEGTTKPADTTAPTKAPLTTKPNQGGIILVDPNEEQWY